MASGGDRHQRSFSSHPATSLSSWSAQQGAGRSSEQRGPLLSPTPSSIQCGPRWRELASQLQVTHPPFPGSPSCLTVLACPPAPAFRHCHHHVSSCLGEPALPPSVDGVPLHGKCLQGAAGVTEPVRATRDLPKLGAPPGQMPQSTCLQRKPERGPRLGKSGCSR